MSRLERTSSAAAERARIYYQARDDGQRQEDAAREAGISYETSRRYEVSYRKARGLPPREKRSPERLSPAGSPDYVPWRI